MDSMVSKTLIIEQEVDDTRSIRDASASDKKRGSQASSSGSGKKQRTSVPRGFQGRGRSQQGQGQVRVTSQAGKMTFFHCHQPGHMRRNCPQIQGFQDHGTPQSRSSVGHEQTHYVPPYPSTGHGNRYQSQGAQGATRALSVSQTG